MQPFKVKPWELVNHALNQIAYNLKADSSASFITYFDAVKIPKISLDDYIKRIHKYANCSEACYILSFIYLDRLLHKNPSFVLSMKNIHRLILLTTVIAIKYLDDLYADNKFYAIIGGITLKELNLLETDILRLLSYELYVDPELFSQYYTELEFYYQKEREEPMIDLMEEELKSTIDNESIMSDGTINSVINAC